MKKSWKLPRGKVTKATNPESGSETNGSHNSPNNKQMQRQKLVQLNINRPANPYALHEHDEV